jgi:PAS domain S-box-containing protein
MKQNAGWTRAIEPAQSSTRIAATTQHIARWIARFEGPVKNKRVVHRATIATYHPTGRVRLLLFILLAAALFTPVETFAQSSGTGQAPRPRVLVLHSYHDGFTWSDNISRGIRSVIPGGDAELCFEFMDTRRLFTDEYFDELQKLYAVKYAGRAVNVIVCADDHALNFILSRGGDVFPGVPVLFCSVSGYDPAMHEERELTGLRESIDIKATLDAALSLHPDTYRVTVITDMTRTGRAIKANAEDVFRQYRPRIEFQYLEDVTFDEMRERVADLSDGEIVLLFIFSQDSDGRVLSHEENLRRLAPRCRVPIYAVWEFYLGHGIVGGKLTNGEEEGRLIGEMALRVLAGENASEIPIGISPTKYMFDFRQLERFGVPVTALPAGSQVVGRPFSFYETYKTAIVGVVSAFVVLLGLVVFLFTNIRQRRTVEAALREGKERMQLVLKGGNLGLWDLAATTGVITFNERAARTLGYRLDEIDNDVNAWRKSIHPDDLPAVTEAFDAHAHGKSDFFEAEHRVRTKQGQWTWIYTRGMVVERGEDGSPIRVSGTQLDVNDRRQAEADRRALEAQVQHAQKLESLGVLAGGIAHDFNNLLTGIMGNANLALLELPLNSSTRENVVEIERASLRAAELCKQMLAYSGRGSFVIEKINLSEMVQEMVHLLEVSTSKKAALNYRYADKLPKIEADVTQMRQIAMNLITNASEAIGDANGVITVSTGSMFCDRLYLQDVFLDEELPEGSYVFIEVADNGCGMDPDTVKRIFDPFFTTKFTGRGLGLSAVLGIVRGHRGAIKIYTEPGAGTTFKVLIPANDETAADVERLQTERKKEDKWQGQGTVLIVDDDETVRNVATRMLERMGMDTLTAVDGKDAIELFKERMDEIVCVLLDLTMPQMDGVECFRELHRLNPEVHVILSSGFNEQEATQRFTGKGLAGFIQKPYVSEILSRKLREILVT